MSDSWSNKEQLATDLTARQYDRNAKGRFSLALALFLPILFSFPEMIRIKQRTKVRDVYGVKHQRNDTLMKGELLTWTNLSRLTRLAFLRLSLCRTVHTTERRGWIGTVPHSRPHAAATWFGALRPSGPRTIISIDWFYCKRDNIWKYIFMENLSDIAVIRFS